MLATVQNWLNRLLPFATPGTPLLQDLLHLAVLCAALFYAPQIQTVVQQKIHGLSRTKPREAIEDELDGEARARSGEEQARDEQALDDHHVPPHAQPELDEGVRAEQAGPAGPQDDFDGGDAGPANPRHQHQADFQAPQSRQVGAKKAKSLARRDQRRAYHEFQRSQGEAQRARDAEGAAAREATLAKERERRAEAEAAIAAREAKVREAKRQTEQMEREAEMKRREEAVSAVRKRLASCGMVRLDDVAEQVGGGVDSAWVASLARAAGLLGRKAEDVVMLTNSGWVVKVGREHVEECYRRALKQEHLADEQGRVSFQQFGAILEEVIRQKSVGAC